MRSGYGFESVVGAARNVVHETLQRLQPQLVLVATKPIQAHALHLDVGVDNVLLEQTPCRVRQRRAIGAAVEEAVVAHERSAGYTPRSTELSAASSSANMRSVLAHGLPGEA